MTSFGSLAMSPIKASLFTATFTSTPTCFAVSASFIWKNKSSISATTLPIRSASSETLRTVCLDSMRSSFPAALVSR